MSDSTMNYELKEKWLHAQRGVQPFFFPAELRRLFTQAESFDNCTIAGDVAALQVVEQGATLTNQTSEGTLGAVVLAVLLHVLSQVTDAVAEQSNLALSAAGIGSALAILAKNLFFLS